jgi:hypothetical protein
MASFGSWPLIMVNDRTALTVESLSQFSIAALGYPASRRDRLTPRQAAQNLLEELTVEFKRRDYQEVYFIAHSLGGVITKQLLLDSLQRTPNVFFLCEEVLIYDAPESATFPRIFSSSARRF